MCSLFELVINKLNFLKILLYKWTITQQVFKHSVEHTYYIYILKLLLISKVKKINIKVDNKPINIVFNLR